MAMYVVTYDLLKQGQNYNCLIQKLKTYPIHWHAQGSVWFVKSSLSATAIRDSLSTCLDANDKLIVARLNGEAAWIGYGADVNQWIKNNFAS